MSFKGLTDAGKGLYNTGKGIVESIGSIFGSSPKGASSASLNGADRANIAKSLNAFYEIDSGNWYTAKPYGFKLMTGNATSMVMFLPISPSNITINTNFATNMIPTLYGTVEEHSPVRYYDISIEGTTGMAPKYITPVIGTPKQAHENSKSLKTGRTTFSVNQGISLFGFFPKTLGLINKTLNKAADLLDGGPSTKMGIANENSGYVAFHNLYRFLLEYKKTMTEQNESYRKQPLIFFNYKDNNQYHVVVRNFTLRRSAENPMIYYYSIQMRGYNLRSAGKEDIKEDINDRLEALGLNGVKSSSLFGSIKSISNTVKSGVGIVRGGIGAFGR